MLALILLAAPPLAAAVTVAAQPGTATGPGIDGYRGRDALADPAVNAAPSVSGPVAVQGRYRGHTAYEWAGRFRRRTRQYQNARRVLHHTPQVVEAINLACAAYGNCQILWRKAGCETGGTYSPRSLNSSSGAGGLFQFLPSTWRSTPYGRFDVFSPYASALAAGWMHAHGRGSEWACR